MQGFLARFQATIQTLLINNTKDCLLTKEQVEMHTNFSQIQSH